MMKSLNSTVSLGLWAALITGVAFAAAPAAHAQTTDTSAPMVVKQTPPKPVWMKAEVITATNVSIVVREQDNERAIHTFTYSQRVRDKMQKYIDTDTNYQNGDKVRIRYMPGETEALEIKGKPSKAPG